MMITQLTMGVCQIRGLAKSVAVSDRCGEFATKHGSFGVMIGRRSVYKDLQVKQLRILTDFFGLLARIHFLRRSAKNTLDRKMGNLV